MTTLTTAEIQIAAIREEIPEDTPTKVLRQAKRALVRKSSTVRATSVALAEIYADAAERCQASLDAQRQAKVRMQRVTKARGILCALASFGAQPGDSVTFHVGSVLLTKPAGPNGRTWCPLDLAPGQICTYSVHKRRYKTDYYHVYVTQVT